MRSILCCFILISFGVNACMGYGTDTLNLYPKIDTVLFKYKEDLLSRKQALNVQILELHSQTGAYNLSIDQFEKLQLVVDSVTTSLIRKTLIYDVRDIKNKDFRKSDWSVEYGVLEAKIIGINLILGDMMNKNIIHDEYPHDLTGRRTFHQHIDFFDVSDGQVILDIGGGSGLFALVLAMMYEDMIIGYNEANDRALKYMRHECKVNKLIKASNQIEFYEGKVNSTRAENQQFDKVLLIYTLHHFKRKGKMLAAIAASIKHGKLYISEPIKSDGHKTCQKAMEVSEIYKTLLTSNYSVLQEHEREQFILLKCAAIPSD